MQANNTYIASKRVINFIGLEKVTNIFLPVSIGLSALDWHSETQMVLCYCISLFSKNGNAFSQILMFYYIMLNFVQQLMEYNNRF